MLMRPRAAIRMSALGKTLARSYAQRPVFLLCSRPVRFKSALLPARSSYTSLSILGEDPGPARSLFRSPPSGRDISGHKDILRKSDYLQKPDRIPGNVDLIPPKSLARRTWKSVMVVVPTLPEDNQGNQEVIHRLVHLLRPEGTGAIHMAHRIDQTECVK